MRTTRIRFLAATLAAAACAATAGAQTWVNPTQFVSAVRAAKLALADGKPETFGSCRERIDYVHEHLPSKLDSYVRGTDLVLAGTNAAVAAPVSRFRLTVYVEFSYDDSPQVKFSPNYDASVQLPNLEKRWDVFIENQGKNDLPGVDPMDRTSSSEIGLRKFAEKLPIQTDVGITLKWLPSAFARAEWKPEWAWYWWVFRPGQRFYYQTDNGPGSITSFSIHRWFGGEKPKAYYQYVAAMKWTETTTGVGWEQTLRLGYVNQVLMSNWRWNWKRTVDSDDMARGWTLQGSFFGHSSSTTVVDSRLIRLVYRRPLYKRWVFLEVAPGVEWLRENNWNTTPILRVGLDMLFWGSPEQ